MITNQAYFFLIFVIDGFIIGMLFDLFRVFRKTIKFSDINICIQDALFWILTGIVLLYTIFVFCDGEIRLYMFLGTFIGCLIYMLSLSKYFIKVNLTIMKFITSILEFIKKVINKIFGKPIRFIIINLAKKKDFWKLCRKNK